MSGGPQPSAVRARPWYADSPAVQTYGLRLARVEKERARGAREPAAHVVLLGLTMRRMVDDALERSHPFMGGEVARC
jgi:hypothetical protein